MRRGLPVVSAASDTNPDTKQRPLALCSRTVAEFTEAEHGGAAVPMKSSSPRPAIQQFILDCGELASCLDTLDTRANRPELLSAVVTGEAQYHALVERRQALSPSPLEEAWVDFMLDALRSRLGYLESRMGMARQGT